jgi:hypothetical protein
MPPNMSVMSEPKMIGLMNAALKHNGVDDKINVVGQFAPRGTSGAMFAGVMIATDLGDVAGSVGRGIGAGVGMLGGTAAASAATGLPKKMVVGALDTTVYGMHTSTRSREPDALLFVVQRAGLKVIVHQRVNVRVLELIHEETGSRIELEGNRMPVTHANDLIKYLTRNNRG